MNRQNKIALATFGAFLVIVLVAVIVTKRRTPPEPSWDQRKQEIAAIEEDLKETASQIKKSAGNGKCEGAYECHLVGLGVKTCGNYRDYLIYSSADTEEPLLKRLIQRFNEQSEKLNNLLLTVPGCGVPARPVRCEKNRCSV